MLRTTAFVVALWTLVFSAFVGLEGCGSDPWTIPCGGTFDPPCEDGATCWERECLPFCKTTADCPTKDNSGLPVSLVCIEGTCYRTSNAPDAGTSDAGDAGDAGKSAICGEPCAPVPDGWSSMQAVWIGPVEKAPSYTPPELGGQFVLPVFTGRADLDAAPAECDVCSCAESTGKCTDLPSSIDVHAAMCGQPGTSLSFDGPANWTGSCTNVNAIVGGQTCPAGSSTLCAQSVAVAPLGAPVDESCMPFIEPLPDLPVLKLHRSDVQWKTAAVGYDVPDCNANESCMPSINDLPSGFRSCIYQRGEHECPASWSGDRRVVYEVYADKPGFIDARNCSPCSCGAPIGSVCTAQFRVFEDAACTKLVLADPITSFDGQCTNVLPAGKAIGSKEITSLAYFPGTCEPLGGEPIGEVKPDPDQAVTFCCPAQDA
jgi:hypothetical protein